MKATVHEKGGEEADAAPGGGGVSAAAPQATDQADSVDSRVSKLAELVLKIIYGLERIGPSISDTSHAQSLEGATGNLTSGPEGDVVEAFVQTGSSPSLDTTSEEKKRKKFVRLLRSKNFISQSDVKELKALVRRQSKATEDEEMQKAKNGNEKGDRRWWRCGADGRGREDVYLPEDTFSLMAMAPIPSWSFVLGFGVFLLQMATLSMLSWDIVLLDENSFLGLPPFTSSPVRISQIIAIFIAIISQWDILASINILINGYSREILSPSPAAHSDETYQNEGRSETKKECSKCIQSLQAAWSGNQVLVNKCKWQFANICRGSEGLFSLGVTFALVMRSETVRDLLLNFTAVEFVSNVDNIVFQLAKWRYFGCEVREMTRKKIISDDKFYDANKLGSDVAFGRNEERPICKLSTNLMIFTVIFILFFSFWVHLSNMQGSGDYLPPSFYVQFGDNEVSLQGFASGTYKRAPIHGRFLFLKSGEITYQYKAKKQTESDDKVLFHYCENEATWAFARGNFERIDDACEESNWIVKSSELADKVFALPSSSGEMQWFIKLNDANATRGREVQMGFVRFQEDVTSATTRCKMVALDVTENTADDLMCDIGVRGGSLRSNLYFTMVQQVDPSDNRKTKPVLSYGLPIYARETDYGVSLLLSVGRRWAHILVYTHGIGSKHIALTNSRTIESIGDLANDIETHLKLGDTSFLTEPGPNIQRISNSNETLVATLLSEAFDIRQPDSGSPAGLHFFRTGSSEGVDKDCSFAPKSFAIDESKDDRITGFSCVKSKAPTDQPTVSPTIAPTRKPTLSPTNAPTRKPTFQPTASPSTTMPTRESLQIDVTHNTFPRECCKYGTLNMTFSGCSVADGRSDINSNQAQFFRPWSSNSDGRNDAWNSDDMSVPGSRNNKPAQPGSDAKISIEGADYDIDRLIHGYVPVKHFGFLINHTTAVLLPNGTRVCWSGSAEFARGGLGHSSFESAEFSGLLLKVRTV